MRIELEGIGRPDRLARSGRAVIMERWGRPRYRREGYGVDDGEVGRAEDRVVGNMESGASVGQVISEVDWLAADEGPAEKGR